MRNKLLFVTDLGGLKAYRVTYDGISSSPRMELVESFETIDAHCKMSDKLTDEAGRSEGGNPLAKGVRSFGEKHNIKTELAKRCVKNIAKSINALVKKETEILDCFFAASKEINSQILDELDPSVRERIVKNVPDDLIRVDKSELLKHFAAARA